MILHILNQTNIVTSVLMTFRPLSQSHEYTSGITLCAFFLIDSNILCILSVSLGWFLFINYID